MNDSKFAVIVFVCWCMGCFYVGALAMWIAMTGTHECSVEVKHTDHTAVHITQCII